MESHFGDYAGKRTLITGGAGCIGSNLTEALINVGVSEVIVLDDLSAAEQWNIPLLSGVTFIKGSILEEEVLRRIFSRKIDLVFHLAAHFANQNSVDNPETDLMVNGLGTLKLLEFCHMTGVDRFIFASSGCSVYGSQAPLPLKEEFVSLHLDTPYQITKLLGELYCNFFNNYYNLPIAVCRFFNVYGPGEIPGRYRNVIPNFMYWALHKKSLPITGTGNETRDFTFVKDIVAGVLSAGVIPEAIGEAFNLASGTETRIIDIAKIINTLTGNNKEVKYVAKRDWDKIDRRRASVEKAKKLLGYVPKTDIETGIRRTLDWFQDNRDRIENCARF